MSDQTGSVHAANLLATPQVGKYTIEGLLGVAGMGAVYRSEWAPCIGRCRARGKSFASGGADGQILIWPL